MSPCEKSKPEILFKLSGSIACYKACALISQLVQAGCSVQTVASDAALQFIGKATLEGLTGRAVLSGLFTDGQMMAHIHNNRAADCVILCPATANTLNALAAGRGDGILGAFFLAHDFSKPYYAVPAMNQAMWAHPSVQHSLKTLSSWGVRMIEGEAGHQACGEAGYGRMAEPEAILARLKADGILP